MDLQYLIHHVFLPPDLPQEDDSDPRKDRVLTDLVLETLRDAVAFDPSSSCWTNLFTMADALPRKDNPDVVTIPQLIEALGSMVSDGVLVFHIRAQNAGLIVRKKEKTYAFESFELSPTTGAVITTAGRLLRIFPGPSIAVDSDRVHDITFREALAHCIVQLDSQVLEDACPKSRKAGAEAVEIRQTANPKYVTQMLTGIFRAIGMPQDVQRIQKYTRDDVLWHRTLMPWRRSPRWLLLRVALQMGTKEESDNPRWRTRYKMFMILFLTKILTMARAEGVSVEKLFIMTAKISRRMLKLGQAVDQMPWLQAVRNSMDNAQEDLEKRWNFIQQNPDPTGFNESSGLVLQVSDTYLRLSSTKEYLREILARQPSQADPRPEIAPCAARIQQDSFRLPSMGLLKKAAHTNHPLFLLDVEGWVQNHLQDWLAVNLLGSPPKKSCGNLSDMLSIYLKSASKAYESDPEKFSMMVLTVMDIWVALDKCVISYEPLLKQYQPGFTASVFHILLLPKKDDLTRLFRIEQYIKLRDSEAESSYPTLFLQANKPQSFAVRYFEQSSHHQKLKEDIERVATSERDNKVEELARLKADRQSLLHQAQSMSCSTVTVTRGRHNNMIQLTEHNPGCQKCKIEDTAQNMSINIHEWPLPQTDVEAKNVVFELDVPKLISIWRESTYQILADLLSPDFDAPLVAVEKYTLFSFSGINRWLKTPRESRVQLASPCKEMSRSHYKCQNVSMVTPQSVCVNLGLRCVMYDGKSFSWTEKVLGNQSLGRACTFELPPGPYKTLQHVLDDCCHTSNEVLATQDLCPESLTLHEFYSFSTLRAGHRLQWRNIAREIASHSMNFNHTETHLLMMQAAYEAGPGASSPSRDSHVDLDEYSFGMSLISTLDDGISGVESNWQGASAVRTFTALALRLLSLSPHAAVHQRCFALLYRIRLIVMKWVHEVNEMLHATEEETELKKLACRILDLALTCHATYDINGSHLLMALMSAQNLSILVECTITIHDRRPAGNLGLDASILSELARFNRRSHLLESVVRTQISLDCSGLDLAISRLWAGYNPSGGWRALNSPQDRWMFTQVSAKGSQLVTDIHYNILNGTLLVNGIPLSRLPDDYESHTTYRRLFGGRIFEVVPSQIVGMAFESRREIHGHQVHFSLQNGELIILARKDGCSYELLPLRAVSGDFPDSFVADYAHWLDLQVGSVEFRPIRTPWTSSRENWRTCPKGLNGFSLLQSPRQLIDIGSRAAQIIHEILGSLEAAHHIHVMANFEECVIEVHLPRMGLDFVIEEHSNLIMSKQFRNMCVDADQSIGTLNGLLSRLVLRQVDGSSRMIIVPNGRVLHRKHHDHVQIVIETKDQKHVSYHQFQIDDQLGRLVDNGSLGSRLFKIYLHAVTSFCLPDKLTGRTGTEEALDNLTWASTQSFATFSNEDVELLYCISRLSPRREYYPKHLQTMELVTWRDFPILQQHDRFFTLVESLKSNATSLQVFQESNITPPPLGEPRRFPQLYARAKIRLSNIRVDGYGAEDFTIEEDRLYLSRDQTEDENEMPSRELQVCSVAKLVDAWSHDLKSCPTLLLTFERWEAPISAFARTIPNTLGFHDSLLQEASILYPSSWCNFQKALASCDRLQDKYRVMFLMATLTQSPHADLEAIRVLLAFATVRGLSAFQMPECTSINLKHGYWVDRSQLLEIFQARMIDFQKSAESKSLLMPGESRKAANKRRLGQFTCAANAVFDACIQNLMDQWPSCATVGTEWPVIPDLCKYVSEIDVSRAVYERMDDWRANADFRDYLGQIQGAMTGNSIIGDSSTETYLFSGPKATRSTVLRYVGSDDLFHETAPPLVTARPSLVVSQAMARASIVPSASPRAGKLADLLGRLSNRANGEYERHYLLDLEKSYIAFTQESPTPWPIDGDMDSVIQQHLDETSGEAGELYQNLCKYLRHSPTSGHEVCHRALMSPRISPCILLSYLSRGKVDKIPDAWKSAIVRYGVAMTALQRAQRMKACLKNHTELSAELANAGHAGWDPMVQPDWLLLELENNILIREEQAEIAHQMIAPTSGRNSLMQLNMGQGKSSVIVPIVAATVADGTKLARVVVLKSLSTQMFHLLQNKLGGMINRRIYHLPISRTLKLDLDLATQIRELYCRCMESGGILLVQPEHVLSFELLGLDRALACEQDGDMGSALLAGAGRERVGDAMINTQKWLLENSRDILDESDEILSVKFELIYTMGAQRATEFSPDRWLIIQQVLGVLRKKTPAIVAAFPHGMEILPGPSGNSFPRIRILQEDAGRALLAAAARDICEHGITGLPVWNLPPPARTGLFRFLTDASLTAGDMESLGQSALGVDATTSGLLLLRGLFMGGILTFALAQKRWRVNYGLHLGRTRLAVPYQAKDSPSARAEFSHPDTAIVLTCLSYYYGGLNDAQIYASFEQLLQSDHPQEQYQEWIAHLPDLPPAFQQLGGVNLSNTTQCARLLFPLLRFAKGLIDFHMSHLVFPREMKEFTHKLSSSGWEIGRDKHHPTTGFSGTNDSKYVLPVPVQQSDLPQQLHTNAAVLDCLLRPENTVDSTLPDGTGVDTLDADIVLRMAVASHPDHPPIRVILDVGAQILELSNKEVARKWLSMVPTLAAQAAIYVDDRNEICVVTRAGLKEALQVSPFAKLIDRCLVYLDEAHTRGTDLKMPSNYRAIVTLGPDLTKDRLVQACMRLRKLGKGQSVAFCASLEIQLKILQCNGKKAGGIIEVSDVLAWCIINTWQSTKKSLSLWATQGVRHYRRRAACATPSGLPTVPSSVLEPEAQTLEERYGFGGDDSLERAVIFRNAGQALLSPFRGEVDAIREKCRQFALDSLRGVSIQEQQERELQPENERQQQVERPPPLRPHPHFVHPNLFQFAETGNINRFSDAFRPAFGTLENASVGRAFEARAWPQDLLVTADFAQTVIQGEAQMDQYLRPVHWILTLRRIHNGITCVIISPAEANDLLPIIRQKQHVTLHVYTPRLSLANHTLEDLAFCAIPALPVGWVVPPIGSQITLFAGQLYLRCMEEYLDLCQFLGLCYKAPDDWVRVARDGFVNPEDRKWLNKHMDRYCRFKQTPIPFLRGLFVMRRKGQGFANSHLGRMLNGELLRQEHFVVPGSVTEVVE